MSVRSLCRAEGVGDDVSFGLQFTPVEEPEANPATQPYVEIVEAAGGVASDPGGNAPGACGATFELQGSGPRRIADL